LDLPNEIMKKRCLLALLMDISFHLRGNIHPENDLRLDYQLLKLSRKEWDRRHSMHSIIELSSITVYIMKKLVGKSRNIEPQ
jgi:hypothetical protein